MSAAHCLQLMWAGLGAGLFLLVVSVVGRWMMTNASAQIDQRPTKSHLSLAWMSVVVITFIVLLVSIAEWKPVDVTPSKTTILVNENDNAIASDQARNSVRQPNPATFKSQLESKPQDTAISSPLQASQGRPALAAYFESKTSNEPNVDFLTNPDVVRAEERLLKIAKRESNSEYEHVQDLIRQVRTPGNLASGGWIAIDRQTTRLSTETLVAYHCWREAVFGATPAKYSLQDVEATTSGPAEFRSKQAISAKTHLLNVAAQMGPTDSALVAAAISSVERDGTGWSTSDRLMDKVQWDTDVAYRRWKDAVWSASETDRSER